MTHGIPPGNEQRAASATDAPFLRFQDTASHPCPYLEGRSALLQVATPLARVDTNVYSGLLRRGFRRSGLLAYRPRCPDCAACIPVRLPVAEFTPNRAQRRCLKIHARLHSSEWPLIERAGHSALYHRYQAARHATQATSPDGQESDVTSFTDFLLRSTVDSRLIEFRENGTLRMVSIIDLVDDGLSAVYTFFDPDLKGGSLGTYAILWQIARCAAIGRPYLYLGYWLGDCRKMAYKANFRPLQGLIDGHWQPLAAT